VLAGPPAPTLSPLGYQLLLDYEVGGGEKYYTRHLAHPTWPGFASGVTIAVGYDLGYNSRAVILSDWQTLPAPRPARLAATAGVTGQKAKARTAEVRDILVNWSAAEKVFNRVTVAKFYAQTERAFPGMDRLSLNAQAALTSLVFNRGPSMVGPNRGEMREIRSLVKERDYTGIAAEIRKMKRLWVGSAVETGLSRRRDAESRLILTPDT
jgi:hypothetical protein